jgi:hypothetical protein
LDGFVGNDLIFGIDDTGQKPIRGSAKEKREQEEEERLNALVPPRVEPNGTKSKAYERISQLKPLEKAWIATPHVGCRCDRSKSLLLD